MRALKSVSLLVLVVLTLPFAANRKQYPDFSIKEPFGDCFTTAYVVMSLPTVDGYSSTVRVDVQKSYYTLEELVELSENEAREMGFKIIKLEQRDNKVVMEAEGMLEGSLHHMYSEAYIKDGKRYQISALTLQSLWKEHSKKLLKCVKSFKLNK